MKFQLARERLADGVFVRQLTFGEQLELDNILKAQKKNPDGEQGLYARRLLYLSIVDENGQQLFDSEAATGALPFNLAMEAQTLFLKLNGLDGSTDEPKAEPCPHCKEMIYKDDPFAKKKQPEQSEPTAA